MQRRQQQGLGRPIIAAQMQNGIRFVAVNDRLYHSDKWKTFHDFLGDYIRSVLTPEWGNSEIKKPLERRHPILQWYDKICEQQRRSFMVPGEVISAPMTGAMRAWLHLAYDLYALAHNAEVQRKLIARLQRIESFFGARYEVSVAAALVRAGFSIAFENEDDRSRSHCEFVVTHGRTGKSFSVEAKRAQSGRVVRQIVRALQKDADHPRVVFVDLNSPDDGAAVPVPVYVERAFQQLRRFEELDPAAGRLQPAYLFLTNAPWEHHLETADARQFLLAEGFHIPDFKIDYAAPSLRDAILSRDSHVEMHDLIRSMKMHSGIPSTFDGENPEFAFADAKDRLIIGETYEVPTPEGGTIVGRLESGAVFERERTAVCALLTEGGSSVLFQTPLSDVEMAAWRLHPDTFFGKVSRAHKSETALDFYDFLLETYSKTPKAKLLEFLANAPDLDSLAKLEQPELASVFCERVASQQFAAAGPGPEPLLKGRANLVSRPRPL